MSALRTSIGNLLTLYTPLSAGDEIILPYEDPLDVGDLLPDLIQEDWEIFSDPLLESGRAMELLCAIQASEWEKDSGEDLLDAGDLYTRRSSIYHTSPLETWEAFCEEVRDTPNAEPQFRIPIEEEFVRAETRLAKGSIVFRARVGCALDEEGLNDPYRNVDIGAPPAERSRPARLSRQGEVLLYCADQELTAIGEVRPWRGLVVTLAEFRAVRDLRILDLSTTLALPNPFTASALPYELEVRNVVNAFAHDISQPLERSDDEFGYLPSQKLSEIVRTAGFDGIRYTSALAPRGTNIAFYQPTDAQFVSSRLVRISVVDLKFE